MVSAEIILLLFLFRPNEDAYPQAALRESRMLDYCLVDPVKRRTQLQLPKQSQTGIIYGISHHLN